VAGDDWKPTVPERPSSRDPETIVADSAPPAKERTPASPSQRYVGGEEIARGGMGRVIEATDTLLARTVAVKEALTDDPETLRRFARETRITARLEHPSIVPVYDAGSDPSAPFYVMRRVTGRPLSGMIKAADSLDERLALLPHVLACAHAIAHAHKRGVIHRDIKPNNVLVGEHGETVVIDWGIAKVIGEADDDDALPPMAGDSLRTRIGTVSGTPGFMSPEQARGDEIGTSADVWALGATLYYLLARQMPHETNAKTPDDLLAHAAYRPVPSIATVVGGVPPEIAAITERALAFDVVDRFPDAASFADELSRYLTGQIVASHRYSLREHLVRWVKRHRAIVAVAVLAMTVVAVVSTIAIRNVIAARERADESARQAEASRAKEQRHAQSELLARARAIATTHPTAAIAAIDQLPASSPLQAEADAIFATAISHGGAAWALGQNSGIVSVLEMDLTATKLLQLSHRGHMQIWDMDTRALLLERTLVRELEYPEWIAKGVLIYGKGPTKLLDVAKNTVSELGSSGVKNVIVSQDGSRIAAHMHDQSAGWLDGETGVFTRITGDAHVVSIAMPHDGSWLAAASKTEIVVYAHDGAVILRRAATSPWLAASRSKRLAYLESDKIYDVVVAPNATWTERPSHGVMWPDYHDELLVGRSAGSVYAFAEDPKRPPFSISKLSGISTTMYHVGSGMMTFTTGGNSSDLLYFDSIRTMRIPLPQTVVSPRMTSRRGHRRIAVAGNAAVFLIDLQYMLPRHHADVRGHKARYITKKHIIDVDDQGTWVLHDGDGEARLEMIQNHSDIVDAAGGRVLFADFPYQPTKHYVLNVERMDVKMMPSSFSALCDGGSIYVLGKKLFGRTDAEVEGRELATLAGDDVAILVDGARFWVISGNEMFLGDLPRGVVERKPFTFPRGAMITALGGRMLVGYEKKLRWDTIDGAVIASVEDEIANMYRVIGGAVVTLKSHTTMYIEIGAIGSAQVHHLASTTLTASSDTGRLVVASPSGTEVIELPSRRRWIHPVKNPMPHHLSVPPDGSSLMELTADRMWWEWAFPPANLEIAKLRHTATNAREQDDRLFVAEAALISERGDG
jgi:hypothetical protein